MTIHECTRCGICCATGPCSNGEGEPCIRLEWEGDVAVCSLLRDGKVNPEDIGIRGSGCALKVVPHAYE